MLDENVAWTTRVQLLEQAGERDEAAALYAEAAEVDALLARAESVV